MDLKEAIYNYQNASDCANSSETSERMLSTALLWAIQEIERMNEAKTVEALEAVVGWYNDDNVLLAEMIDTVTDAIEKAKGR